jgi:hypothetical protein
MLRFVVFRDVRDQPAEEPSELFGPFGPAATGPAAGELAAGEPVTPTADQQEPQPEPR